MGRTAYQVFKVAAPLKNDETGEICEDLVSVTCNSKTNNETGEIEVYKKSSFKIPNEEPKLPIKDKMSDRTKLKCDKCSRTRHSLILIIISMSLILPSYAIVIYLLIETLLHNYTHGCPQKKGLALRSKLHRLLYSEFCAFCQSKRSMDLIEKLQDERLAKMRKYVKNIPIIQ